MYITILAEDGKQEIDKCQVQEWFNAIKYVEENKQSYLDKDHTKVQITNKRAKLVCYWDLVPEVRPLLLKDEVSLALKTSCASCSNQCSIEK